MSILLSSVPIFAEQKTPTVLVIGAGLAGLTTAYRLHQKGMNVHVYEAKNRVGGRVFTAIVGGHIAELGGQNIADGGKAENMRRLIGECHLELTETQVPMGNDYYFTGEALIEVRELLRKRNFTPESLHAQLAEVAQKSANMRDVFEEFFKADDPLYKALSVKLAAYEGASVEKLSPFYTNTLVHMLQGGLSPVHPGRSEKSFLEVVTIQGGNALLPEKLAQSLGEKVHLNRPLIAVSKEGAGYSLLFQNGEQVKGDILVLAIPCSTYRNISFEKGLIPQETLAAIENVQYGTNAKIVIPFSQIPSKRTTFINDRAGAFFNPDRTILTLYYTGEAGRFSADDLLEMYRQDYPMIEMGLGSLCPPLSTPVFARDASMTSYEEPVAYSWPNDLYIQGSYSYIAPGQELLFTATEEKAGEKVKTLFTPIDQTLYFAGEHASILAEGVGTMEAACESGERTVRMIEKGTAYVCQGARNESS